MNYRERLSMVVVVLWAVGCAGPRQSAQVTSAQPLRMRALECLKRAVQFRENPVVRVAAVEALAEADGEEIRPWIRTAITDEHPAVRFSGCMAVGTARDSVAASAIRAKLDDPNPNVRVAALFAMHRFGDSSRTGQLARYVLDEPDAAVRRNATMVVGRLDERGAIPLLARAMRDPDPGVQFHALEGLVRLGNNEARQQLVFMANSGVGSDEVLALQAIAEPRDPATRETFRYKLSTAVHPEVRLEAARGLGLLGSAEGLDLALRELRHVPPRRKTPDPDDPPDAQQLRVRQLAAAALGAIGDPRALPPLTQMMEEGTDPRLQVSAARAVLEILARDASAGRPVEPLPKGNAPWEGRKAAGT